MVRSVVLNTLVGIVVGGVVATLGTLVTQIRGQRREDQVRWDQERLEAIAKVLESAAQLEGWHYRRGRAAERGDNEMLVRRTAQVEEGLGALYSAISRTRLLVPQVSGELDSLIEAERRIRSVADFPLEGGSGVWRSEREKYRGAMDLVAAKGRVVLGISN